MTPLPILHPENLGMRCHRARFEHRIALALHSLRHRNEPVTCAAAVAPLAAAAELSVSA